MRDKNTEKQKSESENGAEALARRRIRYVGPMTAGKVLGHPRYWTLPFLRRYLELCDETMFHGPEDGYLLAQHAPELARRIELGEDGYDSEEDKLSWRVYALAVWGSGCRAFGELTQAESAYRLAAELAEDPRVSDDARGELHARRAVLGIVRGTPDPIVECGKAIEFFKTAENPGRLADTLVIRGAARYLAKDPRSLADLTEALSYLDDRTPKGYRTLTALLFNMVVIVSGGRVEIRDQEIAYRLLLKVKRRLPKSKSIYKSKVIWIEGLLLIRLGITRLGKRRLLRARRGLAQSGSAVELAAVSHDLFCLYLEEGDQDAAESLMVDTLQQMREMNATEDLLALAERLRGHLALDDTLVKIRAGILAETPSSFLTAQARDDLADGRQEEGLFRGVLG